MRNETVLRLVFACLKAGNQSVAAETLRLDDSSSPNDQVRCAVCASIQHPTSTPFESQTQTQPIVPKWILPLGSLCPKLLPCPIKLCPIFIPLKPRE